MRRGEFPDAQRQLMKQIENEYLLFKYQMLSKSNAEIYDNCDIIRFYRCVYEYFTYSTDLDKAHISACLKCNNIIDTLYNIYNTYEYLRYDRWEDIEEILNVLSRSEELKAPITYTTPS